MCKKPLTAACVTPPRPCLYIQVLYFRVCFPRGDTSSLRCHDSSRTSKIDTLSVTHVVPLSLVALSSGVVSGSEWYHLFPARPFRYSAAKPCSKTMGFARDRRVPTVSSFFPVMDVIGYRKKFETQFSPLVV